MENNLTQLKKLAQIFNTDKLISPEEIQQIFKGIVEILATYKKDTSSINEDTKSVVNKLLEDVISIHKESVDAVEEKKKELGNDFADKLTELRQMVTSIQEEMDKEDEVPEDDTDDEEEKQALIAEIMAQITLPEVKAAIVSGEEIVDKINELPLDEDNKIDWARIKNAPKIGKQTISGSPTVLANAVDLDGSTRANNYAIVWDATRGRYTHTAMSGGGTPGGSTTQLQYNNAGAFGGISGATTDGTAVTYTANNLKAADITASGSGGFLIQSNSGTDVGLFGAGGGAGATFYGGVNVGGNITLNGSTRYIYGDTTSQSLRLDSAAGVELNYSTNAVKIGSARVQIWTGGTEKVSFSGSTVGLLTTAPTHTLTLGSTGTGIALYNTADQTTNYERGLMYWAANQYRITTDLGGTGISRALVIGAQGLATSLTLTRASVPLATFTHTTAAGAGNYFLFNSLFSGSSTAQVAVAINPTISQTSTAGYTALLVNPTETTTGSGSKLLADFQVGGTSKLNIDNGGEVIQALGKYFRFNSDTNWRIGGVTATAPFTISAIAGNSLKLVHGSGGTDGIAFGPNGGTSTMEMVGGNVYFRGNIELGAVSDTTISRSSAGVIAVEGVVIPSISSTNTLTNKFITPQVQSVADAGGTLTPVSITNDIVIATALSQATTIAAPTGSPVQGEKLTIRLKDNGTARALTWNAIYRAIGVTLPTTTVLSKTLYLGFFYNSTDTKWDLVASAQEA